MGKWSGRGQPPTRKKLHRWREQQDREKRALAKDERGEEQRRQYSWSKLVGKVITNPERFERNWCS